MKMSVLRGKNANLSGADVDLKRTLGMEVPFELQVPGILLVARDQAIRGNRRLYRANVLGLRLSRKWMRATEREQDHDPKELMGKPRLDAEGNR
jgi:hypothetical protein